VSEQFLNGTSAYIRSRHAALGLPLRHRVACVGSVRGLVRLVDYAVAYVVVALAWLVACRMVLSLWSAVAQLTPCVAALHHVATVTVASLRITPLSSRVASCGSSRIGIPCCRDRYGRLSVEYTVIVAILAALDYVAAVTVASLLDYVAAATVVFLGSALLRRRLAVRRRTLV